MGFLHAREPSLPPRPPAAVVAQAVRFGPGPDGAALDAARREWFLPGTQQTLFAVDDAIHSGAACAYQTSTSGPKGLNPQAAAARDAAAMARILAPAPGTVVALDPDIPPERQRLRFEAAHAPAGAQWRIAGQPVGRGSPWLWLPWPGRHRVELLDARGQVLDSLTIEVRGASAAPRGAASAGAAVRPLALESSGVACP
ncbi:MAG: hypothetical protein ACK40S_11770, partial [Burkholderiaceae bacterium]